MVGSCNESEVQGDAPLGQTDQMAGQERESSNADGPIKRST